MKATRPDLAEHVRRIVDEAPPLTPDQRAKLAMLLHIRQEAEADPPLSRGQRDRLGVLLKSPSGGRDSPPLVGSLAEMVAHSE